MKYLFFTIKTEIGEIKVSLTQPQNTSGIPIAAIFTVIAEVASVISVAMLTKTSSPQKKSASNSTS